MNWDAIGAVSETLGTLAVFVSLIYVAVQLRQANAQSQTEAVRQTFSAWKEEYSRTFDSAENVALMRRGLNDYSALSPDEKGVFHGRLICLGMTFETIFNLHQHGQLRGDVFEAIARLFTSIMACPGAQQHWLVSDRERIVPPYMQAYVAGTMPDGRDIVPFNEMNDFLWPSGKSEPIRKSD